MFGQAAVDGAAGRLASGLVLTFGCLHDLPHPGQALQSIGRCIAADGSWLGKDIRAVSAWQENLPGLVLPVVYGNPVTSCLLPGPSGPGGAEQACSAC